MTRTIRTAIYFYIYSYDEDDMVWYSPASDNETKQNQNLLNAIEEARRILRRNPDANIEVCSRAQDMCGEYEYGEDYGGVVCTKDGLDRIEQSIRKGMSK